ncbi:MAG: mechanosensitive ion channel [Deltaproteobacteria bacterium]|nr:mechanosensitive ion channel [Deltaproteobacteria bacterium]
MPYESLEFSVSELAVVTLFLAMSAVLILLALRALRRAVGERRDERRGPLAGRRLLTLAELAISAALLVVVGRWLSHAGPVWSRALGLGLFLAAVAASWFVLRDYAAGLALRATDALRPGDTLRAAGVEGRVRRVGRLWLILETRDGVEVRLPWTRVSAEPIERSAARSQDAKHRFQLVVPPGLDPGLAQAIAREAILSSHAAHPTREPEIALAGPDLLEIDVTALVPTGAGRVASAARDALARAALTTSGRPPG